MLEEFKKKSPWNLLKLYSGGGGGGDGVSFQLKMAVSVEQLEEAVPI